jgi:hypothetical protein
MMEVSFAMPKGMDAESVALYMAAYLLGAAAFSAMRRPDGSTGERPCVDSKGNWMLDDSNDYWMRVKDGTCKMTCRYGGQWEILRAMRRLFLLRNGDRHSTPLSLAERVSFLEWKGFVFGMRDPLLMPGVVGCLMIRRGDYYVIGDDLNDLVDCTLEEYGW